MGFHFVSTEAVGLLKTRRRSILAGQLPLTPNLVSREITTVYERVIPKGTTVPTASASADEAVGHGRIEVTCCGEVS